MNKQLKFCLILLLIIFSLPAYAARYIESGDKILVRIAGIVDKTYEVDHEGYVNFELWGGMLKVADLTIPEATNAIQRQLSKYIRFGERRPYVSLIKKKFLGQENVVSVFGEVKFPGTFPYVFNSTALEYVLKAGGPTELAVTSRISVTCIRGAEVSSMKFDLDSISKQGKNGIPQVHPKCIIYVPKKKFDSPWLQQPPGESIYLVGEFINPGRYEFDKKFSLLDILSQAGGPKPTGDIKRVKIIRGNKLIAVFNLYDYQQGKLKGIPAVFPRDIIYIPTAQKAVWVNEDPKSVVNIMGQVVSPGRYEVESQNLNIINLIAVAGGPTDKADIENIKILRQTATILQDTPKTSLEVAEFDLEKFQQDGDIKDLPEIANGDTIVVPVDKKIDLGFWDDFKTIGGVLGVIYLIVLIW